MSRKRKRAEASSSAPTSFAAPKSLEPRNAHDTQDQHNHDESVSLVKPSAGSKSPGKPPVLAENIRVKSATVSRALGHPRWLYIRVSPISSSPTSVPVLDEMTLRLHLLGAASAYLGDTGAAIPVDILKLFEPFTDKQGGESQQSQKPTPQQAYLRVPFEDGPLFCAAITSWAGNPRADVAGYRILESSCWLGSLNLTGDGGTDDLFDFTAG